VTHVFVLLNGWVKVIAVTADGRESVLALRGTGDVVGETAGETTGVRNATMQALVSVRALIVGYERFSSFIDTHQGGSRAYRRVIVHRWRDAETMLRVRAVTNGAQRLAGLAADGVRVGLYCQAGISRTSTVAIAYLMVRGMPLAAATQLVRQARPQAMPALELWRSLERLAPGLAG